MPFVITIYYTPDVTDFESEEEVETTDAFIKDGVLWVLAVRDDGAYSDEPLWTCVPLHKIDHVVGLLPHRKEAE